MCFVQADEAWADFFYESGVSFRNIDRPSFKKAIELTRAASAAYRPPSRKQLAGDLLDAAHQREKAYVLKQIENAGACGFSVATDGMTYQQRPFTNIIAIEKSVGAMVVNIVDCTAHVQEHGAKDAR